mmetsp:Transcript_18420/g.47210  ORF Transcript_18420/g.47210 Transcript_18420/m.47210 type:complete len:553 (+) Transcript_18420:82-1740(+)
MGELGNLSAQGAGSQFLRVMLGGSSSQRLVSKRGPKWIWPWRQGRGHGELAVFYLRKQKRKSVKSGCIVQPIPLSITRILSGQWVFLIFLNAISMGVEADRNQYERRGIVLSAQRIAEHVFLSCFTLEVSAQLFVYGSAYLKTSWGCFDCIVVAIGILTQWVAGLWVLLSNMPDPTSGESGSVKLLLALRIVRLLRLARAARLMSHFRVLWMLVRGLWAALSTLLWAIVILIVVIYTFAICGMELMLHDPFFVDDASLQVHHFFGTMPKAMLTLLQFTTLDTWAAFVRPVVMKSGWMCWYFGLFMGVSSIAIMNLVTAIIVEVSIEAAHNDRDMLEKTNRAEEAQVVADVKALMERADTDHSGELTPQELVSACMASPDLMEQINALATVQDFLNLFDIFDDDASGSLTPDELCDGFIALRRDPVVALMKQLLKHFHTFEREFWEMASKQPQNGGSCGLTGGEVAARSRIVDQVQLFDTIGFETRLTIDLVSKAEASASFGDEAEDQFRVVREGARACVTGFERSGDFAARCLARCSTLAGLAQELDSGAAL